MSGLVSISNGKKFRELLASKPFVYAPGVYDAYTAGIAAITGHDAVYMSGYSVANSHGYPDFLVITQTEMVSTAADIVRLLASSNDKIHNKPVIADADDGYGGPGNVIRTVHDYIKTGVAGIHIEDQKAPKRCGQVSGKELISLEEAVGKYNAAVEERNRLDPNFFLIARTDALGAVGGSLDEAIRRGRAYADTGVDSVWAEFDSIEREPIRIFAKSMLETHPHIILSFNYSSNKGWNGTKITHEELAEMGYRYIFTTLAALESARMAVSNHLLDLKNNGAAAQWRLEEEKSKHPLGSSQQALNLFPHYLKNVEERFVPGAAERRDRSKGFGGNDPHALKVHGKL